ncbi:MAG: glycyl-radical enzyme activating protein, partial [Deltaproteobacteria bacterium]|nr:glycyl-radical enzyme activating protein [Deltaproteobacteria bacterium]
WCHNPESISPFPQVHWVKSRCIGCKTCLDTCEHGAISLTTDGVQIDRSLCRGCLSCTRACPSTALEALGISWGVDELVTEVMKDRVYFEKSGGGITISGGEPTMQAPFAAAFLRELRERGVHTALDTCGQCSRENLAQLVEHADLFLYDLKEIDPEKHRRFTEATNDRILNNLVFVAETMNRSGRPAELWVRTPIIPEYTATKENITGIGRFIADKLGDTVSHWELCAFNNLCTHKYDGLGLHWACRDFELMSAQEMEYLSDVAKKSGIDPAIVHATGATRVSHEQDTAQNGSPLRLVNSDVHT